MKTAILAITLAIAGCNTPDVHAEHAPECPEPPPAAPECPEPEPTPVPEPCPAPVACPTPAECPLAPPLVQYSEPEACPEPTWPTCPSCAVLDVHWENVAEARLVTIRQLNERVGALRSNLLDCLLDEADAGDP